MAFLTSNAVVLRSYKLGESDRLMTFLTREAGLVKAVAKGAVKSRKRFGGVLLTGTHVQVRIFIKKKTTLHRLDAADLVESYSCMNSDPVLFAAGSHLLELTAAFAVEQQGDSRQFALLTSTLRALCNLGLEERLLRIFELRTLQYAGHAPNFEHCSDCGTQVDPAKTVCFSLKDGSIRCFKCEGDPDLVRLPPGPRRLFSDVVSVEAKKLPKLVFRPKDLEIAKKTIPAFCEYTLTRKLRSLRMLYRLNLDTK